ERDRPRVARLAADERHGVRLAGGSDVELAVVRRVPERDDLLALVGRLAVVDELAVVRADLAEEEVDARQRSEGAEPSFRDGRFEPLAVEKLRDPGPREVLVDRAAAADVGRVAD